MDRITRIDYDALNRPTRYIDPLDQATLTEYDGVGNVTRVTDPLGQVSRFVYDSLDRRMQSIDARGGVTRMEYDAAGNLTRLTDSVGNATTYSYDELNRLAIETDALGAQRRLGYDANGNLTSLLDRNSRRRVFEYDAIDRRTGERWLNPFGGEIEAFTYVFDAAGQLAAATDARSSYRHVYDSAGRLTSVTNAGTPEVPEVAFTYTYDATGALLNRSETIAGAASGVNSYQYDALNRVTQITQAGVGVSPKRVDLAYDAAGQMTNVARFADLAGTQGVATSAYTFDGAGRLTDLAHASTSAVIAQYSWAFDAAGRITRMTSNDGVTDYAYDATNQLLGADHSFQPDESYSYDLNGNRSNPGHETRTGNRLFSDGTFQYHYDAEGNRTRRTHLASGARTEYQWDYRNRLVQVTDFSAGNIITRDSTYAYDVFDRRIAATVDEDGAGPSPPSERRFVYDGHHIALTFDDGGAVPHRYLHGPAVDQILADESANGVVWDLTDHQGTIRDLVDSTGAVKNHLTYDSFGRVVSESNPAVDHSFGYTGRERDETGLHYFRARYYDPVLGEFISRDPLGFAAGDTNLKRFVNNSPPNGRDPYGLESYSDLNSGPLLPTERLASTNNPQWSTAQDANGDYGGLAEDAWVFGSSAVFGAGVSLLVGTGVLPAWFVGSIAVGGAYLGVKEFVTLADRRERTLTFEPIGVELSDAEISQRQLHLILGLIGGGVGSCGVGLWTFLRTPRANSQSLLREVLAVAKSPEFTSRAGKYGAHKKHFDRLEELILSHFDRNSLAACLSGGELTPTKLTIGRLSVLGSREGRIRHELMHLMHEVLERGVLEFATKQGPAFGFRNYYRAEAMAYFAQYGYNPHPLILFNALGQAFPIALRMGVGAPFLYTPYALYNLNNRPSAER